MMTFPLVREFDAGAERGRSVAFPGAMKRPTLYVQAVRTRCTLARLSRRQTRAHERLPDRKFLMETPTLATESTRSPFFGTMQKIPGGLMLAPLVLGSIIGTFAPDALTIGGFTTALFKNSAPAPDRPADLRHGHPGQHPHRRPDPRHRRHHPADEDAGPGHVDHHPGQLRGPERRAGRVDPGHAGGFRQQQRRPVAGLHRPVWRRARSRRLRRQRGQ